MELANQHLTHCKTGKRRDLGMSRSFSVPANMEKQGQTASSPLPVSVSSNVTKSLILAFSPGGHSRHWKDEWRNLGCTVTGQQMSVCRVTGEEQRRAFTDVIVQKLLLSQEKRISKVFQKSACFTSCSFIPSILTTEPTKLSFLI